MSQIILCTAERKEMKKVFDRIIEVRLYVNFVEGCFLDSRSTFVMSNIARWLITVFDQE